MARYEREMRKAMLRKRSTLGGWALASRDGLKAVAAVTRSHDMVTFDPLCLKWRMILSSGASVRAIPTTGTEEPDAE